jgi:D-alanine transaminase
MTTTLRPTLANWNGELLPLEDVKVSVLDRAFLFGDAVYEAMRIYTGKPWLSDEHFERLSRSLREIRIEADVDRLRRRMDETIQASGILEGLVYLQVTRGQGPRSHAWKTPMVPNELIWVQDYGTDPFADQRKKGIGVVSLPDLRWRRCDVKSVNLLGNSMACQAAYESGCIEAILVDEMDDVTEATHSSFFAVLAGEVRTTPNGPRILPGITRNWAVDRLEKKGVPLEEVSISRWDLPAVSEAFLAGTSIEIMPVVAIDGEPVGDGKPGPITTMLMEEYKRDLERFVIREAPAERSAAPRG